MLKNNNTKILLAALGILVLLNVICLYTIWTMREHGQPLPRHKRFMPPGGPKSYVIKELEFNEQQEEEYEKLVYEHRRMMRDTREEIRALKKKLYSRFSATGPDSSEVDKLTRAIADKVAYLEEQTFEHFQKVRALCSDRQKEKFDKIIDRVIDMMSEGGPHPPPPPPPHPPRF